jgi:hypothetical protein
MIYDYELKRMTEGDSYNLLNGIVDVDPATGVETYGMFSPNPYNNVTVVTNRGARRTCINGDLLNNKFYKEDPDTGTIYSAAEYGRTFGNGVVRRKVSVDNSHAPYNVEDNRGVFETARKLHDEYNFPVDRDIRLAAKHIKGLTFGAELETILGQVPQYIMNRNGLIICKDGSIRGEDGYYPAEYVTIPLSEAKGIQTLRNAANEISKRCEIDIKCSYHLHIGGIKPDRLFLVSLFKLCTKIQNDVFKMFPLYKLKPEGIKSKNYCKKLPPILGPFLKGTDFNSYINSTYTDIFCFLSGGIRPDEEFNITNKRNPWGENKWNIKTRYYWVNFINLIFHKRQTIEFRLHTPTLNSDKVINWLFMCSAIIKYAETYPQRCISDESISFIDVLSYYGNSRRTEYAQQLSNNLISYYENRCEIFKKDRQARDLTSSHELLSDKQFEFNTLKITR